MTFSTTLSSLESGLENFFVEAESDVQAVIALFQKSGQVVESALSSALSWVAKETPTVVPIIQQAISFAATVGASSTPAGAAVIAAAQLAVTELNAVAQSKGSGATDMQTLLAAYAALKNAQAAAATVTAAATKTVSAP